MHMLPVDLLINYIYCYVLRFGLILFIDHTVHFILMYF